METDPNQTAFPSARDTQTWGLTKREYLAGLIMQGLVVNSTSLMVAGHATVAKKAVKLADELIAALKE